MTSPKTTAKPRSHPPTPNRSSATRATPRTQRMNHRAGGPSCRVKVPIRHEEMPGLNGRVPQSTVNDAVGLGRDRPTVPCQGSRVQIRFGEHKPGIHPWPTF